jgi:GxxExxY protein
MEIELASRGIPFAPQAGFEVMYKGRVVGGGRVDLLVGGRLLVEVKAVDRLGPIHLAQVLSYLKASGQVLGLLVNFHVPVLKEGFRRVIRSTR